MPQFTTQEPRLKEALDHMTEALEILDITGAPGNVGSHLDLAICRLEEVLDVHDRSLDLEAELSEALSITCLESKPVLVWDQR